MCKSQFWRSVDSGHDETEWIETFRAHGVEERGNGISKSMNLAEKTRKLGTIENGLRADVEDRDKRKCNV